MNTAGLQRFTLGLGAALAAVLLTKFAHDLTVMGPLLAAPLWLLALSALAVAALNLSAVVRDGEVRPSGRALRGALLAAIPLGYLAASLDCMGLSAAGCTPYCTFVKLVWIPIVALTCLLYYRTGRRRLLLSITLLCFIPLLPHCLCDNPANGWWIRAVGASPQCYLWGFVVGLIAVTALYRGAWPRLSLAVCYAVITGAVAFFVGHHYFHYPW